MITIDPNNEAQMYDLNALSQWLHALARSLYDYRNVHGNTDHYKSLFADKWQEYWRRDVGELKNNVESDLQYANSALHSLGINDKITINYLPYDND